MFYKFYKTNYDNVCAVTHNELYAASPLDFNDPFEGKSTGEGFKEISEQLNENMHPENVHRYRTRRYVICFSKPKSHFDDIKGNILLWSHYAASHQGFCVEYKDAVEKYLKSLPYYENDRSISYEDAFPIDNGNPTNAIFTKSRCWEYESEYRFIFKSEGLKIIKIDPCNVINAIYLGALMDVNSDFALKLIKFAKNNGIKCYKMECSPTKYNLIAKEMI